MKITLTTLVYIIAFNSVIAQEVSNKYQSNNYAGVIAGLFSVKDNDVFFPLLNTIGINYSRRIYNNIHGDISYMMWLPGHLDLFGNDHFWVEREVDGTPYKVGELVVRENYKMIDIAAIYNFSKPWSRHNVCAGLGITRYWGDNYYIESLSIYHPSVYTTGQGIRESYWGLSQQLSYRYSFYRKKISIGMSFKSRSFFNNKITLETNYLLTLGYLF